MSWAPEIVLGDGKLPWVGGDRGEERESSVAAVLYTGELQLALLVEPPMSRSFWEGRGSWRGHQSPLDG